MGKERSNINLQYDRQLQQIQQQQQWQSSENRIDRQWQAEQWRQQFEKQIAAQREMFTEQLQQQRESDMQKWKEQFDIENQYNSPQAQVERLLAAGINPAALASSLSSGESSAAVGGSSSPGSSSAPSGGTISPHSVSPLGLSMPSFSTDAALFSSAAQLADSLGKLAGQGANVYDTISKTKPTIENIVADTQQKQEETALTKLNSSLVSAYGDKKAAAEIDNLVSRSYAASTQGDYNKAHQLLTEAETKFTESKTLANEEQRPVVLSNMKKLHELYDSEIRANKSSAALNAEKVNTERSQQAVNYSQRDFNSALTETENQIRSGKVQAQDLSNACQRIENQLLKRENIRDIRTNEWKVWKILSECKKQGYATAEQLERWKSAVKDNNSYELRMILQEINSSMPNTVVPVLE